MRKLTVYGGTYDGRNRVIVAAPTKKSAYEAIKKAIPSIGSYRTWDQCTSDSGSKEEVSVAMSMPLVVFSKDSRKMDTEFMPMEGK